jgi:hypothetical protein
VAVLNVFMVFFISSQVSVLTRMVIAKKYTKCYRTTFALFRFAGDPNECVPRHTDESLRVVSYCLQ